IKQARNSAASTARSSAGRANSFAAAGSASSRKFMRIATAERFFWPPRFGPGKPVPAGLDWDLYLGPAPWFPYDGNTGAHRFDIGELNWGQHHYDIVQWAAGADATGPVELFMNEGRSAYKYASGVVVY